MDFDEAMRIRNLQANRGFGDQASLADSCSRGVEALRSDFDRQVPDMVRYLENSGLQPAAFEVFAPGYTAFKKKRKKKMSPRGYLVNRGAVKTMLLPDGQLWRHTEDDGTSSTGPLFMNYTPGRDFYVLDHLAGVKFSVHRGQSAISVNGPADTTISIEMSEALARIAQQIVSNHAAM
ncbi:hypothetical protein [Mycolicibacterium sp.]|uniref:hypothetical protein n=1 Tax=Mycolicibacterium sp. TaxID=2320850 RepID=UPI0037C787B3